MAKTSASESSFGDSNITLDATIDPVPMSFPAILRNPKLSDRFARLREGTTTYVSGSSAPTPLKRRSRDEREGKRWIRRRENARFENNPYVVQPGTQDIQLEPPSTRRTFVSRNDETFHIPHSDCAQPEPLPPYLPRSVSAPQATRPKFDPQSANMGHYSMSLKGIRRTLRNHGHRTQILVREIEKEMLGWLAGGTIFLPGEAEDILLIRGRPVGNALMIAEISRTPLQLIWSVEQDPFARYLVHCCARYHKIVSYSKDVDGRRLTYLLRPNVTRSDYATRNILDTPPATESDHSLGVLSESDIVSVDENSSTQENLSDTELPTRNARRRRLSSVSERDDESDVDETPRPLRFHRSRNSDGVADDADDDKSEINGDLAQSVDSLDLSPTTREPPPRYASQYPERTPFRVRERRAASRASSSPSHSRSPCPSSRKRLRRGRNRPRRTARDTRQSFYDYLYS